MSESTEDYLQQLLAEGQRDSSGHFTLSSTVLVKLRSYQLAKPHFYVLPLVSEATRRGATRVEVRNDSDEMEMFFDGCPLTDGEIEGLASSLVCESEVDSPSDLLLALNSALGLKPRELTVETPRTKLTCDAGGQLSLQKGRTTEDWWSTRFYLREVANLSVVGQFLLQLVGGRPPETAALAQFCCFAPMTIRSNHRVITQAVDLGICPAWCHLEGEAPLPVEPSTAPVQRRVKSPGPFSAVIGVGGTWYNSGYLGSKSGSCAAFVVDGVSYLKEYLGQLGGHSVRAVVAAPGLKLDLSRTGVVENELYQSIVQALREEIQALVGQLVEEWRPEFWKMGVAYQVLEQAGRSLRRAGRLAELVAVQRKLAENESPERSRELAGVLARAGQLEEAEGLLRALLKPRSSALGRYHLQAELSSVLQAGGQTREALSLAQRSLRGFHKKYKGFGHPENHVLPVREQVARLHFSAGEIKEAQKVCSRGERLARKAARQGSDPVELPRALGRLYLAAGLESEAERYFNEWVGQLRARAESAPGGWDNDFALGSAYDHLAYLAYRRDRTESAHTLCENALEAYRAVDESHPEVAGTLALQGLLAFLADPGRAGELWAQARDLLVDRFGSRHPEVTRMSLHLAAARLAGGRENEVVVWLSDSLKAQPNPDLSEYLAALLVEGDPAQALAVLNQVEGWTDPERPFMRPTFTLTHHEWWAPTHPGRGHQPLEVSWTLPGLQTRVGKALFMLAGETRSGVSQYLQRRAEHLLS